MLYKEYNRILAHYQPLTWHERKEEASRKVEINRRSSKHNKLLDSKVRVCVVIFEAHSESIKAREITNKVDQKVNRTFEKQLRDQS